MARTKFEVTSFKDAAEVQPLPSTSSLSLASLSSSDFSIVSGKHYSVCNIMCETRAKVQ